MLWQILAKVGDDAVFDDQVGIVQTRYIAHLFSLEFPDIRRQNTCQCTYIIYDSLHLFATVF